MLKLPPPLASPAVKTEDGKTAEWLKRFFENYVFPMFPPEPKLGTPRREKGRGILFPNRDGTELQICWTKREGDRRADLAVKRDIPFSPDEVSLLEKIVLCGRRLNDVWGKPFFDETALSVLTEAIVLFFSESKQNDLLNQVIHYLVTTLSRFSSETYEGRRVAISVGIEEQIKSSSEKIGPKKEDKVRFRLIRDFFSGDISKVVSNGYDTITIFDGKGVFQEYRYIDRETLEPVPSDRYYPIRLEKIARWSLNGPDVKRFAFVLNQSGDILLFKDGNIVFAKRRGVWAYLSHEAILSKLPKTQDEQLKKAVYETCIDVAFAKTGGCIGILGAKTQSFSKSSSLKSLLSPADYLPVETDLDSEKLPIPDNALKNPRLEILRLLIREKKFQEFHRLQRMEIVALDGATLVKETGELIATSAILLLRGRDEHGGGRTAAARSIGSVKGGTGIKLSSDGNIQIYRDKKLIYRGY